MGNNMKNCCVDRGRPISVRFDDVDPDIEEDNMSASHKVEVLRRASKLLSAKRHSALGFRPPEPPGVDRRLSARHEKGKGAASSETLKNPGGQEQALYEF
mmetsp:Transcript_54592/g.158579  ORF Transcript_54592/g.158579 Transcript_54592/m.158579 type:complete len:100 (+) Transcript_54592:67-366(+)